MRNAVQGGLIMAESDMLPSCKWIVTLGLKPCLMAGSQAMMFPFTTGEMM